jgi:hypothetical protein
MTGYCEHGIEASGSTKYYEFVGFEVFIAVVMKSIIFWDVTDSTDYTASHPRRLYSTMNFLTNRATISCQR